MPQEKLPAYCIPTPQVIGIPLVQYRLPGAQRARHALHIQGNKILIREPASHALITQHDEQPCRQNNADAESSEATRSVCESSPQQYSNHATLQIRLHPQVIQ